MKMLSSEVKTLLDKLYNLRGEDSVILAKMNKERQEAIETGERTKNEKEVLLNKIEKLSNEEKTLQEEGDKLSSILSNINRDDFSNVLDRLQIDFDPASINEKITRMLPETIEKVVSENKKASEELETVETEMNNAITKVEELGIRKDEALSNQAKLNESFEDKAHNTVVITNKTTSDRFIISYKEPYDSISYSHGDSNFVNAIQIFETQCDETLGCSNYAGISETIEKLKAIQASYYNSSSQIKNPCSPNPQIPFKLYL